LYPTDWTPSVQDSQGRFLHDFSYAGYHNGEQDPPPAPPGPVFNAVTDFGADNQNGSDATAAIQAAIDAAASAGGGVVYLPSGLYRCDGVLHVTHSGIVLQGDGEHQTLLYFTRVAGMAYAAHITFSATIASSEEKLLARDGENRSTRVYVDDAGGLSVGDDVSVGWVITDAFIDEHGMTGVWSASNNQWRPIFRRRIVAINAASTPVELVLDVPLRYPALMRDLASVRRETGHLAECGIQSLSVNKYCFLERELLYYGA
jgi:hypothetical protein